MAVMGRTVSHPHYEKRFPRLAEAAIRALIRHQGRLSPGQYLLLHRVESQRGSYYIPLLVHVVREYDGKSALVHPAPLDKTIDPVAKRFKVTVPYGAKLLGVLETVLNEGRFEPREDVHFYVVNRLGTRRSEIQYPGIPEYANDYPANRLLQEVEPGSNVYVLRPRSTFVFEYHQRNGSEEVRLRPYDPQVHGPVRLKTVWSEQTVKPLQRIPPARFSQMEEEELQRRRSQRRFSAE